MLPFSLLLSSKQTLAFHHHEIFQNSSRSNFSVKAWIMRSELRKAATVLSSSSRLSSRQTLSSPAGCFHCATRTWAIAHPITAHGPPPKAPTPAPEFSNSNDPRRGNQKTEQQQQQQNQGSSGTGAGAANPSDSATRLSQAKPSPLKRRFWKDVNVTESQGEMRCLSCYSLSLPYSVLSFATRENTKPGHRSN